MKQLNSLRVWLFVVLLLCFSLSGQAQFLRTSYFMEGSNQRMQLNPALMPGRGYLNIPVIGSLNATVNSSSLGYRDIMDIIENSDDSDYFMSNDFMNRLDATNNLNVNLSTDILSAGWYKGKNFWSVNVGLRNDIGAAIPKTMFQFMNNMSSREFGDNISDYLGINETINGQKLEINSYAEVGLGFARNITDRLAVGGKVKMLLGIGNLKLNINQIHVETPSVGSSGVTSKASIQVDATLENSSKLLELPENENGDYIDEIDFGSFGFAGYGGAIDLGVSYKLLDKLTLSASVLDLGFIKWSKSNTSIARANTEQTYDLLDPASQQEFMDIKYKNKERLAKYILEHNGVEVDPHSIFDVQVKRLHEYKRQLLNILHVIYLYNQIKMHPEMEFYPRTFIFGAKASAGYATAKKIIKLINSVADIVNNDASINGKIKVVFIENYRVSNAEWIFAAADVSEQISTASKEASGTGNMKFMLNGAPTLGTMDGANVEIVEEVGAENAFIFGLSSDEVINYENNGGYDPNVIYNTDEEIRQVLMQLINGTFSNDTELFRDLYDSLLNTKNTDRADRYFILADFRSYADAQKRVEAAYKDEKGWAKKALLNTACSGKFTSDRTIQEYVDDIWHLDKVIVRKK